MTGKGASQEEATGAAQGDGRLQARRDGGSLSERRGRNVCDGIVLVQCSLLFVFPGLQAFSFHFSELLRFTESEGNLLGVACSAQEATASNGEAKDFKRAVMRICSSPQSCECLEPRAK
jgi:hypothetical protein